MKRRLHLPPNYAAAARGMASLCEYLPLFGEVDAERMFKAGQDAAREMDDRVRAVLLPFRPAPGPAPTFTVVLEG